ncbi:transporter [Plakobranchus ocellatus]|uniref:Transporter n=1 Tax=Plakobranchus ocellatus TaxID=259542 RepID=A0AAV4DIY9_9GAST|nr:transporter [Plakobranchus ocellatus]
MAELKVTGAGTGCQNVTSKDVESGVGGTSSGGGDEGQRKRSAWDSKLQYLFMVVSFAVGLGTFWRFPFLTQKHGGGAFLIPYVVMMCIEGVPLLYLELAIGQRLRSGCVEVWNQIHPLLAGLGLTTVVACLCVGIYFPAIIMWVCFYLFHSFQSPLPWSDCPVYTTEANLTQPEPACDLSDPASYFWYHNALKISPGIDHPGGFQLEMLGCHILVWGLLCLCVSKGIKSSGKVAYVTTSLPYVVMVIFFIRGITLKGSVTGITHMFTPEMKDLLQLQPWFDAASQIFFSIGVGFGGLIAFASYSPMHNNIFRDAILVCFVNVIVAVFGSAVTFCIIGFKATVTYERCLDHEVKTVPELASRFGSVTVQCNIELLEGICSNGSLSGAICHGHNVSVPITRQMFEQEFMDRIPEFENLTLPDQTFRYCNLQDDLNEVVEGTGLVFIVYTQAINEFGPSAPFWSVVFFLMLMSMGIGAMFGNLECWLSAVYDMNLCPRMKKRWVISCKSSGRRFADEIQWMIGFRPNIIWRMMWKFVSPAALLAMFVSSLFLQFSEPITYRAYNEQTARMQDATYPWYAILTSTALVLSSILWIPGVALGRKLGLFHYDNAGKGTGEPATCTDSTTTIVD